MCRLLVSRCSGLALALCMFGAFGAVASAQEKPAEAPQLRTPPATQKLAKINTESAYERIMEALDEPTEMDFVEVPLKDVVDSLRIKYGIEIQLDVKSLTDAGITADTPITRSLKGISLRSALRLMLADHEMSIVLADEVLVITSPEPNELRQYDASDLLADGSSIEGLSNAVRFALPRVSANAAKSDGSAAGPGAASAPGQFTGGGQSAAPEPDGEVIPFGTILLVRTNDRGHRDVSNLLAELRHRMKSQKEH